MIAPTSRPRVARLNWRNWAIRAEALAMLALASAAIRMLPFRRVAAAAETWGARTASRTQKAETAPLRRAVQAWARRVPWKAVCFQQGLALHLMLRRRGIASVLHYGVAQTAAEGLAAHVWVSAGGRTIIGGEEAARFTCLATFPAASSQ